MARAVGLIEDTGHRHGVDHPIQMTVDNPVLHRLSDDARLVVSEPLGDLQGAWREVPESTCLVVRGGHEEMRPFAPSVPQSVG